MSESYPDLLCFVDLETTGLDPEKCVILEVGLLLVNGRLDRLDSRSWAVHQPAEVLGGMDEWCLRQHGKSGLIADCAASKFSLEYAAAQAFGFLASRSTLTGLAGKVPMAGASVHFDRAFLRRHMPEVERWFYYGNLDVSSVEKVARLWYPDLPKWEDRGLHRVDPDNEDAVAELSYYRQHIFVPVDGAKP